MSIVEYSAEAVGREWTEVDHLHLVRVMGEIDRTAQAVYDLNATEARESDRRSVAGL